MYRIADLNLPSKTKIFTVDTDVDACANLDPDANANVTTTALPVLSYKQVNPIALRKAKIVYFLSAIWLIKTAWLIKG